MAFTSLDLVLHTEALLSAINFLSAVLSSGSASSPERDTRTKTKDKTMLAKDSQYTQTHTHTHDVTLNMSVRMDADDVFAVSCPGFS